MFFRLKNVISNITIDKKRFLTQFNKNKLISCEKYGCSNCSNCDKIFDCNKFFLGLLVGNSLGFYFGYNYYKKLYS